MGRHYHFRPGSFYRQDDKTGFPTRMEQTLKQWDSQIVDKRVYEVRHPQDFVRGTKDDQTVPDARPVAPDTFVGPVWTTATSAVAIGALAVQVDSTSGFTIGDKIRIMLSDGTMFRATITGIAGSTISFTPAVTRKVDVGAQVWDFGGNG